MIEQSILDEREKNIYIQYQDVIAPFIAELEVRDSEYPIEIFNEIRAIFTHLSRYKIQKSEYDVISAENHVKRAILDCYKYLCFSIKEQIYAFRMDYRTVDLKLADNGKFLPQLNKMDSLAKKAFNKAKKAEIKKDITEDELYELFEEAYNTYSALDKFVEDSEEAILFASIHSKRGNIITIASIIITLISIVVTAITIALA